MSTTMHELLTSAVADRELALGEGHAFAREHAAPVRRAIQRRRIATYAGTGTVATVATLGAAYGAHQWSGGMLAPAEQLTTSPSESSRTPLATSPSETVETDGVATTVETSLVRVAIDPPDYYPDDTPYPVYIYYATRGQADMVAFPTWGASNPGIGDVPADAFIVSINGDAEGYDLDDPDRASALRAFSLASDHSDLVGDGHDVTGTIMWESIGHVSSTNEWGVRYFMLDGRLVSVADGESNPNAIEVVAMFEPQSTP